MKLCEANRKLSEDVKGFLQNVPDVKEESITDYLVWKWGELDKRFNYINIKTFTRNEENLITGADFEIELWLVGRKFQFPLVFQAKKAIKPFDSYVSKLNYPKNTQAQLKKLLNYARSKGRLPFYAFYSIPDDTTQVMCAANQAYESGVFMMDAFTAKAFADRKHGSKVSKNKLLSATNPFHCMFCCPLMRHGKYFIRYFRHIAEHLDIVVDHGIPNYVSLLLTGQLREMGREEMLAVVRQNELTVYRVVGVYDMRDLD
jgi:hypothetical protein